MSSQPPPYQRVPILQSDFEDFPSSFVANRSHGRFFDKHTAIASVNSTYENEADQPARSVFLGLKLTGFSYNPPETHGNFTSEGIVVVRLDLLATISSSPGNGDRPKIEELSLSCEFDKSAGADVSVGLYEPFLYNLQTIKKGSGWASPSESFATWKSVDNRYQKAGVIDEFPMTFHSSNIFYSLNPLVDHEFILTLTLTYSFNPSIKGSLSTSLYIAIKD